MNFPTICIDNFFDNFQEVLNLSTTLKYQRSPQGLYPGERTEPTHLKLNSFFQKSTCKMIAALYPTEWQALDWKATQRFQKTKGDEFQGPGFAHQDIYLAEVSCLIYLSAEEDAGTCLLKAKGFPNLDGMNTKIKGFKDVKTMKEQTFIQEREKHNNQFIETAYFKAIPNRCIMFDSSIYHMVKSFGDNKKDRFTLQTFIESITRKNNTLLKYHLSECRKI